MNLDELQREWRARDQQLEKSIRLNTALLRENLLEKNLREIRKLGFGGWSELITSIPCIVLLGMFNAAHWLNWKFFIPGVSLQVWVTVMLAIGIQQRVALRALDFGQPLVFLQRELENLKIRRMRTLKWALLTGQVVWFVPFLIVLFKGLFGVDVYTISDWMRDFMLLNIAVGVAAIPVAIWLSRLFAGRWGRSGWWQRFTDSLAGRDMQAAKVFLVKLERFEEGT